MSETRLTKQEFNAVLQCLLDVSATVGKWHEPIDKKICDRLNAAVVLMVEANKRPAEPPLPCEEEHDLQRWVWTASGMLESGIGDVEKDQYITESDALALIASLKETAERNGKYADDERKRGDDNRELLAGEPLATNEPPEPSGVELTVYHVEWGDGECTIPMVKEADALALIRSLQSENAQLRGEVEGRRKLVELCERIAKNRTSLEMSEQEDHEADYAGAFDFIIEEARGLVANLTGEEPSSGGAG